MWAKKSIQPVRTYITHHWHWPTLPSPSLALPWAPPLVAHLTQLHSSDTKVRYIGPLEVIWQSSFTSVLIIICSHGISPRNSPRFSHLFRYLFIRKKRQRRRNKEGTHCKTYCKSLRSRRLLEALKVTTGHYISTILLNWTGLDWIGLDWIGL